MRLKTGAFKMMFNPLKYIYKIFPPDFVVVFVQILYFFSDSVLEECVFLEIYAIIQSSS